MGGKIGGPSAEMVMKFWNGVSMIVGALLIFALGWLIAKFIRLLASKFFKIIKIDKLSEDSGLRHFLKKAI